MRAIAVIALLIVGLGVSAAVAAGPSAPPQTPDPGIADGSKQRKLDRARALWKASGPQSYRYEIRRTCYCGQQESRVVVVRNGKPTRFPAGMSSVATVPRVFAVIQQAIDADASKLTASYGKRGIPREIFVDRSMYTADEESRYSISRFTSLEYSGR